MLSFVPGRRAGEPMTLFADWLTEAVAAGVDEPHAMTLPTVGAGRRSGPPGADPEGPRRRGPGHFATEPISAKGAQLAVNPQVALGFYWREQGRQIRVRGPVQPAAPESAPRTSWPGRSAPAWPSLAGRQSTVLHDRADLDRELADVHARLAADPALVAEHAHRLPPHADERGVLAGRRGTPARPAALPPRRGRVGARAALALTGRRQPSWATRSSTVVTGRSQTKPRQT